MGRKRNLGGGQEARGKPGKAVRRDDVRNLDALPRQRAGAGQPRLRVLLCNADDAPAGPNGIAVADLR